MKTVFVLLTVALLAAAGIAYAISQATDEVQVQSAAQEKTLVQTLEFRLQCIAPVAFKRTDAWHLCPEKTFFLQTDEGEKEFRFLEVPDNPLLSEIPRDAEISRNVRLEVVFTGKPDDRAFAKCELRSLIFLN